MNGQNVMASILPLASKPLSSYDDDYLLKLHPNTFPWGKGRKPEGMSHVNYYRILLQRVPMAQFGHNVALLFSMWDQWQRHEVNRQANLFVAKSSPEMISLLNNISEDDFQSALSAIGKSGSNLSRAKSKMSFNAKTLLNLLRRISARIPGSPQAKASLRSQALAGNTVFGPSTIMLNLCPAEIAAKWVFEMGEPRITYRFNAVTGEPDNSRPPKLEALRYIAKNYMACQHFFAIYLEAFQDIFLGWPKGATKQVNPKCIFGVILSIMWSFEESGRRGIHGHAPITVPVLQMPNIIKLCKEGMQMLILKFAESLAMSYMPSAYDDIMSSVGNIMLIGFMICHLLYSSSPKSLISVLHRLILL